MHGRNTLALVAILAATVVAPAAAAPSAGATAPGRAPATNVVVVLDLSDRIDPARHPGQAAQDLKVLEGLVTLFEERVRRSLYLLSGDRLVFCVAPQPTAYQDEVTTLADRLRISMPDLNASGRLRGKPAFDQARTEVLAGLQRLYARASSSPGYVGADLWTFFRDRMESYLVPEPGARNVVVVLTDGYINFDRDVERRRPRQGARTSYMEVAAMRGRTGWQARFDRGEAGLISFRGRLDRTDVAVVGLRWLDVADRPIVERYWSGWLGEMGAARTRYIPADDSTAQMCEALRRFIG